MSFYEVINSLIDYAKSLNLTDITNAEIRSNETKTTARLISKDKSTIEVVMTEEGTSHSVICDHAYYATTNRQVDGCIAVICSKCGHISCACSVNLGEVSFEHSRLKGHYYIGDEYYCEFELKRT